MMMNKEMTALNTSVGADVGQSLERSNNTITQNQTADHENVRQTGKFPDQLREKGRFCSIFGNALDNAVEHESMIAEPQKRLIHVTVSSQKGFVFIKIENYCEEEIQKDEHRLIRTTKADRQKHGYGLRSIIASVEKYGGAVDFGQQNNWFTLKILIPRGE